MKLPRPDRPLLFAFLAGALLPLAFAPFFIYPIAVLAPALLFYLWREGSAVEAG